MNFYMKTIPLKHLEELHVYMKYFSNNFIFSPFFVTLYCTHICTPKRADAMITHCPEMLSIQKKRLTDSFESLHKSPCESFEILF